MTRSVNPDGRSRVTHRQTDLRHDGTIRDRLSSCAADTRINMILYIFIIIILKYG